MQRYRLPRPEDAAQPGLAISRDGPETSRVIERVYPEPPEELRFPDLVLIVVTAERAAERQAEAVARFKPGSRVGSGSDMRALARGRLAARDAGQALHELAVLGPQPFVRAALVLGHGAGDARSGAAHGSCRSFAER